ncbi:MAG: alpha/beta fold hydrolase [Myxococcota bacterium]
MAEARSGDGTRIYWEAIGQGPPLILCNASFSTHRHWSEVAALLAPRLRVVTWDYRGHGRSESPEPEERYSMARVLDDLAAVHAAVCGLEPVAVGGLSIGGLVALRYALDHPERVRALVLANTGPGFKDPEAARRWSEILERAAAKLERVGLEKYLEGRGAQAELVGLRPDSSGARKAVAGFLAQQVPGLAHFARQVAGPVPNLLDALRQVAPPTLILAGALDRAFQRASQVLAARIPRSKRVEVAGAGHVIQLDRPEEFARQVEGFLLGL